MLATPIYLKHILFCKYFAAISVASSVQVLYGSIFTSSYKVSRGYKTISNKKAHTAKEVIKVYSCRISADKKYKSTHKGAL